MQVLVAGHGEGEVWGLDTHPLAAKFATSSYDGSIRIWDLANKVIIVPNFLKIFFIYRSIEKYTYFF